MEIVKRFAKGVTLMQNSFLKTNPVLEEYVSPGEGVAINKNPSFQLSFD